VTGILAVTAGLLIIGGLLGIGSGLGRRPRAAGRRTESVAELWARVSRRPTGSRGRRRDVILLLSVITGCAAAMLTGWLILIVVLSRVTSMSMLMVAVPTHFPLPDSYFISRYSSMLTETMPSASTSPRSRK